MHRKELESRIHAYARRTRSLDPEALVLCFQFGDLNGRIHDAGEEYMARHGLSVSRFKVLVELFHSPREACSPAELAEWVNLTRASMTTVLDGLEKQGLVLRTRHEEDRRMIGITLTAEGRAFMDSTLPDHYRRFTRILTHLSQPERNRLIGLMEKLLRGCGELRGEEA